MAQIIHDTDATTPIPINLTQLKPKPAGYIYHPRLNAPESGNPYYNRTDIGGYSTAIIGNYPMDAPAALRTGYPGLNVVPNCVGYAYGRFNEIVGEGKMKYLSPVNGGDFLDRWFGSRKEQARKDGEWGWQPKLGACAVWKTTGSEGHVAIVEQINPDGSIITSEWGWKSPNFSLYTRRQGSSGNWVEGCSWMENRAPKDTFQGFIYNPAVPEDVAVGNAVAGQTWSGPTSSLTLKTSLEQLKNNLFSFIGLSKTQSNNQQELVEYEEVTEEREVKRARTIDYAGVLNQTKTTNLLTYPTNVETPFIILTVGNYTFGTYNAVGNGNKLKVTYPNFIQGLEVTKINGTLNQYTIRLVYQIQKGDDPNLVDKIFSTVGYGTIKISYGDWSAPTMIYKEEEAIITKLTSNVDFTSAKIIYTLLCTSTALGLISSSFSFQPQWAKPSDVIKRILFDQRYGLTKVFTGMKNLSQVNMNGWIASNDKVVQIEGQHNVDPLSYINYLVTCMIGDTNADDSVLLDSSYYLTLVDDTYGEQGGPYFTIRQMFSNSKTLNNQNVYEVDVGFPSEAMVMSFNIRDENSWALLYNYNDSIQSQDYVYNIDNEGRVTTEYSPSYSTSATHYATTPSQKTWWTRMTQFPITATLEIKGLVRPAMLMTYVKVNAFFYGERHVSSGLYFVTKQVDKVDGHGYRTTLTLIRFAGDEDYISTEKETITYLVPKVTEKEQINNNTGASKRQVGGSSGRGIGLRPGASGRGFDNLENVDNKHTHYSGSNDHTHRSGSFDDEDDYSEQQR